MNDQILPSDRLRKFAVYWGISVHNFIHLEMSLEIDFKFKYLKTTFSGKF